MTNPNLHRRSELKLDALSEATEQWFCFTVVSGTAQRSQDRSRTWAAELADDPTYQRLPGTVQEQVVTGLRDAETKAMNTQLRDLANELRAPRWHPSSSKIALPPEDTKPYPPQAFTVALESAHAQALDQVETVTRDAAARYLKDAFDQLGARGWEVDLDLEEELHPQPSVKTEHRDDERVYVFCLGPDQTLQADPDPINGPALEFTGPLTEQDLSFVHLVAAALHATAPAPAQAAFPAGAATGIDTRSAPMRHAAAAADPVR